MRRLVALLVLLAPTLASATVVNDLTSYARVEATTVPFTPVRFYDRVTVPVVEELFAEIDAGANSPALDDPAGTRLVGLVAQYLGSAVADASGRVTFHVPRSHEPTDGTVDIYAVFDLDNRFVVARNPANDASYEQQPLYRVPTVAEYAVPEGATLAWGDLFARADRHRLEDGAIYCNPSTFPEPHEIDECPDPTHGYRQVYGWPSESNVDAAYLQYARVTSRGAALEQLERAHQIRTDDMTKARLLVPIDPVFAPAEAWYSDGVIHLRAGQDESILLHEYAHHLMDNRLGGLPPESSGSHGPCSDGTVGFAWSGGFAEWFAYVAVRDYAIAGDAAHKMRNSTAFCEGATNVGGVDNVLRDLSDGAGDDEAAGDVPKVWRVLNRAKYDNVTAFAKGWRCHFGDTELGRSVVPVAARFGIEAESSPSCGTSPPPEDGTNTALA